MNLVDTHCHIQSIGQNNGEVNTRSLWAKAPELTAKSVIDAAHSSGVDQLICVGCDLDDSTLACKFVEGREDCFASIGIHPHEADNYAINPNKLEEFKLLTSKPRVIAIGECGLDYFYNHSDRQNQFMILKFQIELAIEASLPMIFHVRDAFDDFWRILEEYPGIRGVLHSFTDSKANLDKAINKGLKIGVNGIATFTKNIEQLEMYKSIPISSLVLETDAPFLTPVPYRGEICQPKFVKQTAEFLAELRGDSLESLAAATTSNAKELFGI